MGDPTTSSTADGRPSARDRGLYFRGVEDLEGPKKPGPGQTADDEGKLTDVERGLAAPKAATSTTPPSLPDEPDPRGRHVDDFLHAIYDIDDAAVQGHVSSRLTVEYEDGTHIKIRFDEIGDAPYARIPPNAAFFYLGRGNRVFPKVLNRGTAPNLWAAKQSALAVRDEFNRDFLLLMSMSMTAISFVFPPATAGLPWRFRLTPPPGRPRSHAIYDGIDARLNRLRKRLGRPHIPDESELPGPTKPSVTKSTKPVAILPNGKPVPPDHHGPMYHGTDKYSPEQVVRENGIPPKGGARDPRLYEHTADGKNSDFRGVTDIIRSPDPEAKQGAAEFALYSADEGWVYAIEGAPIWDLRRHLEGRVPHPVYGYRNARPGTQAEAESVTKSHIPLKHITGVWRVQRIEGRIRIDKLDWGRIKATTKTSDVPSSL